MGKIKGFVCLIFVFCGCITLHNNESVCYAQTINDGMEYQTSLDRYNDVAIQIKENGKYKITISYESTSPEMDSEPLTFFVYDKNENDIGGDICVDINEISDDVYTLEKGKYYVSVKEDLYDIDKAASLNITIKLEKKNSKRVPYKKASKLLEKYKNKYTHFKKSKKKVYLIQDGIESDVSVTDTVAPTLKLDKTEFKIAKGAVFDIDTHATIKDRDENVELKANGEIDMEREGKYTVSYYAVDSSGNESDPIDVNISVVDRSGADFRNAFFGDDADTIKEFETSVFDSLNSQKDVLIFNGEYIEGVACEVTYLFDGEGKMNIGFYSNNKSTGTECLNDYDKWVALLKEEYGEPDIQSVNNLSSLAEYCSSDGQALELGYVQYWTEYDKGNMIISCYAESRDYRPYTILRYALTVASDGGFDSNELGNYKVKYVATTQKGKSEEFAFTISYDEDGYSMMLIAYPYIRSHPQGKNSYLTYSIEGTLYWVGYELQDDLDVDCLTIGNSNSKMKFKDITVNEKNRFNYKYLLYDDECKWKCTIFKSYGSNNRDINKLIKILESKKVYIRVDGSNGAWYKTELNNETRKQWLYGVKCYKKMFNKYQ